jgi:hypothetical protein
MIKIGKKQNHATDTAFQYKRSELDTNGLTPDTRHLKPKVASSRTLKLCAAASRRRDP